MKYLCLVYYRESDVERMSPEEWRALNAECVLYSESITRSGHRLGGEALEPSRTAITVRMRGGNLATTDGPFAETKEQLAGFYFIEAADLPEAVQIAGKIPPARFGSIEIRPVRSLSDARACEASRS
jgi:hypothetical protein